MKVITLHIIIIIIINKHFNVSICDVNEVTSTNKSEAWTVASQIVASQIVASQIVAIQIVASQIVASQIVASQLKARWKKCVFLFIVEYLN